MLPEIQVLYLLISAQFNFTFPNAYFLQGFPNKSFMPILSDHYILICNLLQPPSYHYYSVVVMYKSCSSWLCNVLSYPFYPPLHVYVILLCTVYSHYEFIVLRMLQC